ncbi:MAG: winged helix-turn-helix domain-containing protein [Acidobacteria bacterium]|nr:winged helix-turn-helix domain-containing protein [Acidobacteriota bacterium]
MIDDTAIAALQRSLSENREAKRKIQTRLAELEAEAEMLRSQLTTFNAIIGQTELALRRVLFPDESHETDRLPFTSRAGRPSGHRSSNYDPSELRASEAEIEAEVAKIEQTEKSSNIRFNDFRIPQAATIVLREANRPLHVSEIYRRLADGGFEFRGQHQLITLAVSLSRSKRFRKVAPGTFEIDPDYRAGQVA